MTICIELVSPAISIKRLLILLVVLLDKIELGLVIEVELLTSTLALALVAFWRLLWEAAGALRVLVVSDYLLLPLSYLQERVDVEAWRVLHHEEAVLVNKFLVGVRWGRGWGVRMRAWRRARAAWRRAGCAWLGFGGLLVRGHYAASAYHTWSTYLNFNVTTVFTIRFLRFFNFWQAQAS